VDPALPAHCQDAAEHRQRLDPMFKNPRFNLTQSVQGANLVAGGIPQVRLSKYQSRVAHRVGLLRFPRRYQGLLDAKHPPLPGLQAAKPTVPPFAPQAGSPFIGVDNEKIPVGVK
jgi:hypothetical protein